MKRLVWTIVVGCAVLCGGLRADELATLCERFARVEAGGDAFDVSAHQPFEAESALQKGEAILAAQRPDGSWPEVDYTANTLGLWAPGVGHIRERTLVLARLYQRSHDQRYAEAVRRALDWWVAAKLRCRNWWWNEIGAPQDFGTAALLIEKTLTPEDRRRYADYLECSQIRMTGQNRVWLARVVMIRGLLRRDEALVDKAVKTIADEVVVSQGPEGIASDWSFRQHGPQLQFGNYGASFLMNMARLANVFATTRWAFSDEKLDILYHLGQDGFRWTLWNGNLDHSCLCRQICFDAQRRKAAAIAEALVTLEGAGRKFPSESPRGFRYYPEGAFAVYRPGTWMATVKMCTPKVLETETWVNGENTLGGHLSDGALFTYVTGREYENIGPLWKNWRLIPGVTSYADLPPVQRNWPKIGANECDDITALPAPAGPGATLAFGFRRDGLSLTKRWTFTPDGILCSGEGLSSTNTASRVVTCVEHALAAPDCRVLPYADGRLVVVNGPITYTIHAPEKAIAVKIEERAGDWEGIYPPSVGHPVRARVLEITIDHGIAPKNASYLYAISPQPPRPLENFCSIMPLTGKNEN